MSGEGEHSILMQWIIQPKKDCGPVICSHLHGVIILTKRNQTQKVKCHTLSVRGGN